MHTKTAKFGLGTQVSITLVMKGLQVKLWYDTAAMDSP